MPRSKEASLVVVVLVATFSTSCGSGETTVVDVPAEPWRTNTPLRQPDVLASANGEMRDPLRVQPFTRKIDNLTIDGCDEITTRSYDGQMPGPTIRVKPGDVIGPRLTNDLAPEEREPPTDWPMNVPHQLNYTNLHTHGLHVSPGSNANGTESDNVLLAIAPGDSVQFEIQVPENHPPGSFWYHPHRHGSVLAGTASGLSGMLIVEDPPGLMPAWITAAEERVIVIHQIDIQPAPDCDDLTIDYDDPPTSALQIEDLFVAAHSQGPFYLINGQHRPVIRMRPGEVQRWRLLNGMADEFWPVSIDPEDSTSVARPEMRIIARDGLTLEYPEVPTRNQGSDVGGAAVHDTAYDRRLRVGPGNRIDVMVQAPAEPSVFIIQSTGDDGNDGNPFINRPVLAYLVIEGDPVDMKFPPAPSATTPAAPLPAAWGPGKLFPTTLVGEPVSRAPTIGYFVCPRGAPSTECLSAWERYDSPTDPPAVVPPDPLFLVTGPNPADSGGATPGSGSETVALQFGGTRLDHCMALGSVEEWTICNPSASSHPFHIHTNAFEVTHINGVELSPTDASDPGFLNIKWLDTVPVPSKRVREPTDLGPWDCVDWDKDDPDDVAAGPPATLPGSVKLRTEVVDFTGFMVQHCHILKHEDLGMMQLIEIYDPQGPPTSLPGTTTPSRCTNLLAGAAD